MNPLVPLIFFLTAFSTAFSGQDAHRESHANKGATFKEGVGVQLSEATAEALGLTLAEVNETSIRPRMKLTAQVYREAREISRDGHEPAGFAYASAWISADAASLAPEGADVETFHDGRRLTGRVLRYDGTISAASGRMEVLLQVDDVDHRLKVGHFLEAELRSDAPRPVTTVPESALLRTAFGKSVFVLNGTSFLRTPVQTGHSESGRVEILDGLYEGDQVASGPVQALYLIELRATKGGGHSH